MDDSQPTTQHFRFLELPAEIRIKIYQYISQAAGICIKPELSSIGRLVSPSTTSLACRQIHSEYEDVMYTSAPTITAHVHYWNFEHVKKFLFAQRWQHFVDGKGLRASRKQRQLRIIFHLSLSCHDLMGRLWGWVQYAAERCYDQGEKNGDGSRLTPFEIKYFVREPSPLVSEHGQAMKTLCRNVTKVMDVIYGEWFMKTPPGNLKKELGKLCDCFSQLEARVQPVPW